MILKPRQVVQPKNNMHVLSMHNFFSEGRRNFREDPSDGKTAFARVVSRGSVMECLDRASAKSRIFPRCTPCRVRGAVVTRRVQYRLKRVWVCTATPAALRNHPFGR